MKDLLLTISLIIVSNSTFANYLQIQSTSVNFETDGILEENIGLDAGFDSDSGISIEYGFHDGFENGFSIQYSGVNAGATWSHTLTSSEATSINSTLDNFISTEVNNLLDIDINSGDILSLSEDYEVSVLMLKYNLNSDLGERFFYSTYLGIGFTRVDFDADISYITPSNQLAVTSGDSDTLFTYELGLGLGYYLTENISIIMNYTYRDAQDGEFSYFGVPLPDTDVGLTSLDLGVRMNF